MLDIERKSRNDCDFHLLLKNSSSSSSESSSGGGFSSSESSKSVYALKSRSSCYDMQWPKPIRTSFSSQNHQSEKPKHENGFVKTKSKALKIYDPKKPPPPQPNAVVGFHRKPPPSSSSNSFFFFFFFIFSIPWMCWPLVTQEGDAWVGIICLSFQFVVFFFFCIVYCFMPQTFSIKATFFYSIIIHKV